MYFQDQRVVTYDPAYETDVPADSPRTQCFSGPSTLCAASRDQGRRRMNFVEQRRQHAALAVDVGRRAA